MDEGTREVGLGGDQEGASRQQDPAELRREIQHTREELGDTVEALAHKADVKAQARERVEEVKAGATQKRDEVVSKVREATPDSAAAGAESLSNAARNNLAPLGMMGVFIAGLVVGRLLSRR